MDERFFFRYCFCISFISVIFDRGHVTDFSVIFFILHQCLQINFTIVLFPHKWLAREGSFLRFHYDISILPNNHNGIKSNFEGAFFFFMNLRFHEIFLNNSRKNSLKIKWIFPKKAGGWKWKCFAIKLSNPLCHLMHTINVCSFPAFPLFY